MGDYSYQIAIKPIDKKVKINIGNHESSPKYGLNQYMKSFGLSKQYYSFDLVLQGHIHNYQRTYPIQYNSKKPTSPIVTTKSTSNYNNPKGEVFVIVGTGGINFHGLKSKASFVSKQDAIRFGALDFTITNSGKKLDAKFYGNDGSIRDSFTIQK